MYNHSKELFRVETLTLHPFGVKMIDKLVSDVLLGRRHTHEIRKILSRNVTPEMKVSIDYTGIARRNPDPYVYDIEASRPRPGHVENNT